MNQTKISVCRFSKLFIAGLLAAVSAQAARADEIRIEMLDSSNSGPLAFQPAFVNAKLGDTIVFLPTQKGGHSSVSLLVPPGAKSWSGATDKETRIKLDKEGVYLYGCSAHKMMGMVGVVLVGKPVNIEAAKKTAMEASSKFLMNKDRFEKVLAQVK